MANITKIYHRCPLKIKKVVSFSSINSNFVSNIIVMMNFQSIKKTFAVFALCVLVACDPNLMPDEDIKDNPTGQKPGIGSGNNWAILIQPIRMRI